MFPIEIFRDTVGKLVSILERHGIAFHITGGVTSIAYGDPRMTQDVDFVVDPAAMTASLQGVIDSLAASDFAHEPEEVRRAIAEGGMFQLLDREEVLKLDVYPREMIPGELSRSVQGEVFEGELLPIASRTDTILSKLIWVSKGSHKGRRDLRYLMHGSDESEKNVVHSTASELGLRELLDEVLAEPEEIR